MAKGRQENIPGTEAKTIKPVHNAIENYVQARDDRMALSRVEFEKKAALLQVMKNHKIFDYSVDGHEAHVSLDETVKAKIASAEGEEEE